MRTSARARYAGYRFPTEIIRRLLPPAHGIEPEQTSGWTRRGPVCFAHAAIVVSGTAAPLSNALAQHGLCRHRLLIRPQSRVRTSPGFPAARSRIDSNPIEDVSIDTVVLHGSNTASPGSDKIAELE
jgi:hypothetical protein